MIIRIRTFSSTASQFSFVPRHEPLDFRDVSDLQQLISNVSKLVLITGAGVSTESGIPDYRSDRVGRFATSKNRPVQYQEFVKSAEVRRRYWARNFVGWPKFSSFQPNIVHNAIAYWESSGRLLWTITQNVDDLHKKAGSSRLTELHGSASRVRCLACDYAEPRAAFQTRIRRANPNFNVEAVQIAPDGDVDLNDDQVNSFVMPQCPRCQKSDMKPDIVFFGDNVAQNVVDFCNDKVDSADGLMVLGSSLQVYSGYRFVKRFSERRKPIFIVSIGKTRADELATMKISAKCGDIVPLLKMTKEDYVPLPLMD